MRNVPKVNIPGTGKLRKCRSSQRVKCGKS